MVFFWIPHPRHPITAASGTPQGGGRAGRVRDDNFLESQLMAGEFPSFEFGGLPPEEEQGQGQGPETKPKNDDIELTPSPEQRAGFEVVLSPREDNLLGEGVEKIEKIRSELHELEQTQLPREKVPTNQNPTETVTKRGRRYTIEYVPKEEIYPAFGYGGGDRAVVRQDLSPRVKRFVRAHELYHCQDQATWGGWLGREVRANVVPGLKDPAGLLATVWTTISDVERIKYYFQRIREGR